MFEMPVTAVTLGTSAMDGIGRVALRVTTKRNRHKPAR